MSIPKCRKCPDPEYPLDEQATGKEAIVVLMVVVGIDGQTRDFHVVNSPSADFSHPAIEAVKAWVLDPAVGPDGKPVTVRLPIMVSFRLKR